MADLLLVDDDVELNRAFAAVLEGLGHQVRSAFDGRQGLQLATERKPDLVLLDVEMPVLDGPGMVMGLFVHDMGAEKVPILLTSGVVDLERVARRVGTPYYLGKPFELDRFIALSDRALEERIPPTPDETVGHHNGHAAPDLR